MSYLLGIGHASEDRVVQVEAFPEPDQKARTKPLARQGGGPAATAMVTAARMGQESRLLAAVADDDPGRRILQELRREKVHVDAVSVRQGSRSPTSFVVVEPTGRRTIFWDRGDAEPLRPDEVSPRLVEESSALLVDGHQGAAQIAAVYRAREAAVPTLLDAGSLRDTTRVLLGLVDHAVVSERFAHQAYGRADAEALRLVRSEGPTTAVVTLGERGCLGLADGEPVEVPALAVGAVDTNGAGDVFHGAYLVGLALGLGLAERLRLAGAAAGLACTSPGARTGIPNLEQALSAAGLSTP